MRVMDSLFDAVRSFFDYLASIEWWAVGLGVLCHLGKLGARTRALRNVLAAAYPAVSVRWRAVFGAYTAGVGVNTLLPARGGDVLQLFILKRGIEGATYPTLGAAFVVLAIFDAVLASLLLAWAVIATDALPGLDVIPRLPGIDWLWLFQHPQAAAAVTALLVALAFVAGVWSAKHIDAFRRRVAQGFSAVRAPARYVRSVAAWQALDWALRLTAIVLFLHAFGIPATLVNATLAQVSSSLSTILPLTPAGIGTEQALLAYVLRGEAPTSALLSYSVGMRIVIGAVNVALGFAAIALVLRTLRWREAVADSREPELAAPEGR
jgi:uncharacterized membrane protein YbhN (UPF0104 family)